jgi:uncharacterized protein
MKVNVSDIPEEGLLLEADLPIIINNDTKPDISHVIIKIFRFEKQLLVEGSVKLSTKLICSRCLKDTLLPLDLDFREEYIPAEESEKGIEKELTDRELDIGFYSNDELDINEIVKEQVLLSVPMKPLCSNECQGLCPVCGKDLNEGACNCRKEEMDPRLAPLAQFMETLKNRKE